MPLYFYSQRRLSPFSVTVAKIGDYSLQCGQGFTPRAMRIPKATYCRSNQLDQVRSSDWEMVWLAWYRSGRERVVGIDRASYTRIFDCPKSRVAIEKLSVRGPRPVPIQTPTPCPRGKATACQVRDKVHSPVVQKTHFRFSYFTYRSGNDGSSVTALVYCEVQTYLQCLYTPIHSVLRSKYSSHRRMNFQRLCCKFANFC